MKSQILITILLLFCRINAAPIFHENKNEPNDILIELSQAIRIINAHYTSVFLTKEAKLAVINRDLIAASKLQEKVDLFILKDQIQEEIHHLRIANLNDVSKIRYLKGLQIIMILYEKVLSLDHHFASVRTFNEISKISNPNQYPEYDKLKELLANKRDKKSAFELTSLLGTNCLARI